MDSGIDFARTEHPVTKQSVIAMDTFFVPGVNIWNNSYVEIIYPVEI
jgi:hypothetical protein